MSQILELNSQNIYKISTPKETKCQIKISNQIAADKRISLEEENQGKRSKSCYKTPYISKDNDKSYSKMEMPVSYQLTNGKCIYIRNSQISKSYLNYEYENNNILELMNSKSSDTSRIDNSIVNNRELTQISKGNNSLFNYGKNVEINPMKFVKHHQKKLFKDESQKTNQIYDNRMKTYKKFNLMINPSYKYNSRMSSPIHKYLPYCKKNDEEYKKNLILYIRNKAPGLNNGAKSVSCPFALYTESNYIERPKEDYLQFFALKKKKKIYSTKKIFSAEKELYTYYLINGKNRVDYQHPKKFKFYFDNDIGFDRSWQSPLIIANGDDDVETDDEVLNMAEEKCMDDLVEGINTWNKSSRLCRNFNLVKRLNKLSNTPTFENTLKNKVNNRINGRDNVKIKNISKNKSDGDINLNIISFRK